MSINRRRWPPNPILAGGTQPLRNAPRFLPRLSLQWEAGIEGLLSLPTHRFTRRSALQRYVNQPSGIRSSLGLPAPLRIPHIVSNVVSHISFHMSVGSSSLRWEAGTQRLLSLPTYWFTCRSGLHRYANRYGAALALLWDLILTEVAPAAWECSLLSFCDVLQRAK